MIGVTKMSSKKLHSELLRKKKEIEEALEEGVPMYLDDRKLSVFEMVHIVSKIRTITEVL
jgi:hypothetical protein